MEVKKSISWMLWKSLTKFRLKKLSMYVSDFPRKIKIEIMLKIV